MNPTVGARATSPTVGLPGRERIVPNCGLCEDAFIEEFINSDHNVVVRQGSLTMGQENREEQRKEEGKVHFLLFGVVSLGW